MSNINVVVLTGNLTRDPECHWNGQECERASFSLAVNKVSYRDGQKKESTSYIDCTAGGKKDATVAQYCKKGSKIAVAGELYQSRWTDNQSGQNRSKIYVTVNQFQLL